MPIVIPEKGRKKWWKGLPYAARTKIREDLLAEGKTICSRCCKIKNLKSFSPAPSYWLGVLTACKLCVRKGMKERYHRDPGYKKRVLAAGRKSRRKGAGKKYYRKLVSTEEGRAATRKRAKAYYRKHKAKILAQNRARYQRKRDKLAMDRDPQFQKIKELLGWE